MSLPPILYLIIILGFAGLLLAAALSDVRSLTIPNRICVAIALLYPAYVLTAPQDVNWTGAAMVAGGFLAAGFIFFALRAMGGGDAKLLAAAALWAGPELILPFVFLTAVAGGGMAVVLWLRHLYSRAAAPSLLFATPTDSDFLKRPMPYGVAIAAGGLYVAFTILRLS